MFKFIYFILWVFMTIFTTLGLIFPECPWGIDDCFIVFLIGGIVGIFVELTTKKIDD